jgi:signal transduction histidine kinase
MLALRREVFSEWEERVRESMEESSELPRPLLIDTLPAFYDNIAQAATQGYSCMMSNGGSTVSSEHGGERARLTNYSTETLIREYQILRWTIFDVLQQNGLVLTADEVRVVNISIDAAIREAVAAFALVHKLLREQLVAALTHDMRGPLTVATTALELLLLSNDPSKVESLAGKALGNLMRMDTMIRSLLDSMAMQSGARLHLTIEHFDVGDVLREVQSQIAAADNVRFHIHGHSVKGWWDRDAIKRAIENLIGNALKYGDRTGAVRVSFSEAYERLAITVHNEGEPVPPDEQESIFQIYNRAQPAREGSVKGWGIGLPYVRSVAESHGGSIAVDSAADRGTTFTLDIPLDSRPFQKAPACASPQ